MSEISFKKIGGAALILASLGWSASVLAASVNGTASATVLQPIAIAESQALNFGTFSAPTAGEVTISTAGTRTKNGGVVLVGTDDGQEGRFTVTGTGNHTFSISYPLTPVDMTGPGDTMALQVTGDSATGTLTGGTATFNVGGTLTVNAAQAGGTYTGTYTVTVEYN